LATLTVSMLAAYGAGRTADAAKRSNAQTGPRFAALNDTTPAAFLPTGARIQPGQEGGIAGAPLISECFNAFADGPVSGQFGWTTFTASQLIPVVESVNPIEGAKGVDLPDNPAAANGTFNGIFSPDAGDPPPGQYTGSAKLRIPTATPSVGAAYTVVFQAPSQTFLCNRVVFFPADVAASATVVPDADTDPFDILVLNDPDNAGPAPLQFFATGAEYVPNTVIDFRVELDATANTQNYYINNTLVFTGTVFAGTALEQGLVFSDNFHDVGEIGKTDCVAFEPGIGGGGPCPGDSDGDNDVDADDLTAVILQWGNTCPCTADVDDDNDVDADDLVTVVLNWGPC
jgi:hypothetical protein